jgi:hypothetical protein
MTLADFRVADSDAETGLRSLTMETIYAFLYRDGQKAEQLRRFEPLR